MVVGFGKEIRVRIMLRIGGSRKFLGALLKPVMRGHGLRDIEEL